MNKAIYNKNHVISYLVLRRALGVLGITMPFILVLFSQLGGKTPVLPSISSYYFTNTRDLFTGILCVFSIFLLTYKGYNKKDNITCSITGIIALGVALFPDVADQALDTEYLFKFLPPKTCSIIHYIFASLFSLFLASISLFLFTKSDQKNTSKEKKQRNIIYKICGSIMILCVIFLAVYKLLPETFKLKHGLGESIFFYLESTALISFGISWLIKGETFFKD